MKEDKVTKKCNENCGCQSQDNKRQVQSKADSEKAAEEKLDPTHFGDWQIDCRAIDF